MDEDRTPLAEISNSGRTERRHQTALGSQAGAETAHAAHACGHLSGCALRHRRALTQPLALRVTPDNKGQQPQEELPCLI